MKQKFEEAMEYALDKCIPTHWKQFYLDSPEKVDYDFVTRYFKTPEEFLLFVRHTHLFNSDHRWYPNDIPNLTATKVGHLKERFLQQVLRTPNQVKAFEAMPDIVHKSELPSITAKLGLDYSELSFVRAGNICRTTGTWPHDITYHKIPVRPAALPKMQRTTLFFFGIKYGLYKDHGRVKPDHIYSEYLTFLEIDKLEVTKNYKVLDQYDLIHLFKVYLKSKGYYFRICEPYISFYPEREPYTGEFLHREFKSVDPEPGKRGPYSNIIAR